MELETDCTNVELMEKERNARLEYMKFLSKQRLYFSQKAKVQWIQYGDSSSKFFHATIKSRNTRNKINLLMNEQGVWMNKKKEIVDDLVRYYKKLLGSESLVEPLNPKVLDEGPKVSPQQCLDLCRMVTDEEIKNVIFTMNDVKAPGPDGFSASFFKVAWEIIAVDVIHAVKHFFSTGRLVREINNTALCLIPKGECPKMASDFRFAPSLVAT